MFVVHAVLGLVLCGIALFANQSTKPQVPANKGISKEHHSLPKVKSDKTDHPPEASTQIAPSVANEIGAKNQQAEADQVAQNIEIQRKLVTA